MAREYYYLIAGLPDLFLDQERKDFNISKLLEEMQEQLHPDDYLLVEHINYEYDNYNFLNYLLKRNQEFIPLGKIPLEFYKELDEHVDSLPKHISDFYQWYKGKGESTFEMDDDSEYSEEKTEKGYEVRFQEFFYKYILSSDNQFIFQWFSFLKNLNNILSAISCRKHALDISPQLVGGGEIVEALQRSQVSDFGLKKDVDYVEQLLQIAELNDLMERERKLDLLKWEMADELTSFDYFTIERILAFFVKAGIVYRWSKLDARVGSEMFQKLINELRETYTLPKEFSK